jgi:hypothetical protein
MPTNLAITAFNMAYLLFPSLAAAVSASQQRWVQTLGRAKRAEDVTEFLWPWLVGKDGRTALDVTYNPANIIAPGVTQTLDPVNWPTPGLPQ